MRKAKRLALDQAAFPADRNADPICPLCLRPIPMGQRDEHHLVPRCKKGKITTTLHRACHRQIHALLSEQELATTYHSPEALLEHPAIQAFVTWIKTKPPAFLPKVKSCARLR